VVKEHKFAFQWECGQATQHKVGNEEHQPNADASEQCGFGQDLHKGYNIKNTAHQNNK
jgi:hypothetical protein